MSSLRKRIEKIEAQSSIDDEVSRVVVTDMYGRCRVGGKAFDSAHAAIEYIEALHPGLDQTIPWIILRKMIPELGPWNTYR